MVLYKSREAADDILKTANRVIALLKEADEAQTSADAAIEQAGLDISNANDDLTMVRFKYANDDLTMICFTEAKYLVRFLYNLTAGI